MPKKLICLILLCSSVSGYYRSDINRDGITNLLDFQILACEWLWESEEYVSNKYLTFNGTDQYVTVPDNNALDFGTGDFSISFWMKYNENGYCPMLRKGNTTGYIVFIYDGYLYLSLMSDLATNLRVFRVELNLPTSSVFCLYSLVVDVSENSALFYINNSPFVAELQDTRGLFPDTDNEDILSIASEYGNDFFSGSLDDLRIYKGVALTQAQVSHIYAGGVGCKYTSSQEFEAASVVAFEFDEGTGDSTTSLGTELTGTLEGNVDDNMWESGGIIGYQPPAASTGKKYISDRDPMLVKQGDIFYG